MRRLGVFMFVLAIGLVAAMACGDDEAAAPVIVEKEVIKEVEVPVIVEKEVVKVVEKEVPVEVEKILEVEVPVIVEKEVIKEVILIATPTPTPKPAAVEAGRLGPGPRVTIAWNVSNRRTSTTGDVITNLGWPRKLERLSNGRIEIIDGFSEEQGVSIFQMLTLLRSSLVDISMGGFAMASGEFPIGEGGDLPGLHKDIPQGIKVMEAFVPAIEDRFAKSWNAKFLAVFPISPQVPYCKGEVTGLADLSGKKVRSYSASLTDLLNYLGAQPTSISFGEVYTALERGIIDCGFTGTQAGLNARWYEVTDTLVNVPLLFAFNWYVVNLDSWDRFPKDVREFLEFWFGGQIRDDILEDVTTSYDKDVACLTGKPSCPEGWRGGGKKGTLTEVVRTPADDVLIKNALLESLLPSWVDRCGQGCKEIWNATVAPVVGFQAK